MTGQIGFAPLIPPLWLAALAALAAILSLTALILRARGGLIRLAGFMLLLAILAGPNWRETTSKPLPDIALVLVDDSQSMQIGQRQALTTQAIASLRQSAGATQLVIAGIPPAPDGGTAITPALNASLASIPPAQRAGIILITDGQISDASSLPELPSLTALLTAKAPETDRELRLINPPAFGLVGQTQTIRFQVLDHGTKDTGAQIPVTIAADGRILSTMPVTIGQPASFALPITRAGATTITLAAPPLAGAITALNTQAGFSLTGIRKHLNILLISGSPSPGERAWRVLLKSDPAVQLIHFTILRTPGEPVDAAPGDLALVPFPVQALFETDLQKFDLIILDGFSAGDLLSPTYLGNIARYVTHGGALLAEIGPEFAGPGSLAFTPLGSILPASPAAPGTLTAPFTPTVTGLGARHPVTAPFANQTLPPWYRMQAANISTGDVLMTGAAGNPLLILSSAGQGRVAMLLADQLWLWTRGFGHTGPALPLLRRIVYWLLREPELEPETLSATLDGTALHITRHTIGPTNPGDATITGPNGKTIIAPLANTGPGDFTATRPVPPEPGLWRVAEGGLTAAAARQYANAQEFQDLAATTAKLRGHAQNIIWLGATPPPPLPSLITPRHATQITGTTQIPLLPPLPCLIFALLLLAGAWWREIGA